MPKSPADRHPREFIDAVCTYTDIYEGRPSRMTKSQFIAALRAWTESDGDDANDDARRSRPRRR